MKLDDVKTVVVKLANEMAVPCADGHLPCMRCVWLGYNVLCLVMMLHASTDSSEASKAAQVRLAALIQKGDREGIRDMLLAVVEQLTQKGVDDYVAESGVDEAAIKEDFCSAMKPLS